MSTQEIDMDNSPLINWPIFQELLQMDEDEPGFALSLVQTFVEQAVETFARMDQALTAQDWPGLGSAGHYLKGSAAALGLRAVQEACEKIQRVTGDDQPAAQALVSEARTAYKESVDLLGKFFGEEF